MHFDSDVPGAQVFIDRQFIGIAPVTAEHVKPGSHRLNASVAGLPARSIPVTMSPVSPGSPPRGMKLPFSCWRVLR